jgi:hypothetical protein
MFKIPSLVRLPKYKTFNYLPRYYNPDVEEIRERLAQKRALRGENIEDNNEENDQESQRRTRVLASFKEARRSKELTDLKGNKKSSLIRIGILSFFFLGFYIWWEFGDKLTDLLIEGNSKLVIPIILVTIFGMIILKNILKSR